jgi:hypothetical protein
MKRWKIKFTGLMFTLGLLVSLIALIVTPAMSSSTTNNFLPPAWDSTLGNDLIDTFDMVNSDITEGIELTVMNREGAPAEGANILVYSDVSQLPVLGHILSESIVKTDENGFAFLDVSDGTYILAIASNTDDFFIIKEDVVAPSSLTVNATEETVEVQVTVTKTDGVTPLRGAAVFTTISAYWPMQAGTTNSTGQEVVYLTPYTYRDILIWDWDERYYLYQADITITDTDTTIELNASLMPTGICVNDFVDFSNGAIVPFLESPNELSLGPIFNVMDGSRTLLSEGTYETSVFLYKDGTGQETWEFWTRAETIDITPDETITVYAGGNFTIDVNAEELVYDRGDNVTLNILISDNFSNQILVSYIDATDSSEINQELFICNDGKRFTSNIGSFCDASIENNPTVTIKKPDGNVFSESTDCYFYYYNFTLPVDADEGLWTASVSFDTGPHQGIIGSMTTFAVSEVPPLSVTTLAADNITSNSATLHGHLDSLGTYTSANISFEWGTTSGALDRETTQEIMNSEGDFSADLTELIPYQDYYFRAKAATDGEIVYGVERKLTTTYVCGDVNSDSKVNMADVMILWYDIADYPSAGAWTVANEAAADVNCDGKVNMADVMILWYDIADYPSAGAWEVSCCE